MKQVIKHGNLITERDETKYDAFVYQGIVIDEEEIKLEKFEDEIKEEEMEFEEEEFKPFDEEKLQRIEENAVMKDAPKCVRLGNDSKVNQTCFKKCPTEEEEIIKVSCNGNDGASNHRRYRQNIKMEANTLRKVEQRGMIVGMWQAGKSAQHISETLNISHTTVYKWVRRHENEEQLQDHNRSGRKRKTTAAEDEAILQMATNSSFTNAVKMKNDLHLDVSAQTVRNRLHAGGIHHYVPASKEKLTEIHRESRLTFAQRYAAEGMDFWSRVIFTDEKTFSSTNHGKIHCWRRPNTRNEPQNIYEEKRSGHVTCNIWGWICHTGIGELVQLERPFNSHPYFEILEEVMVPTVRAMALPYPERIIYMHDKSPIHTSRMIQTWFAEQADIELLDWPSKGCDMNPIENVWAIMVNEWEPAEERTSNDLYRHESDVWEGIRRRPPMIERMVGSVPNRLTEVINRMGGWTSY